MIQLINPYVTKILITARDNDSIRTISKRINLSYAWTYKWIEELVALGIIKRKGQKIKVNSKSQIYKNYVNFIKQILKQHSIVDAYSLPNLIGLDYAFTSIDAIFVWTKGGYNIGRSKGSYPIFIEILKKDIYKWGAFFDKYSIKYSITIKRQKGIYFILRPKKQIEREFVEGISVIPLKQTVAFAKKYIFNFEPALEMLDQMYNLNMAVKYAEKNVA